MLIFQELAIDITDRDPTDHPNGVPYKILAEVYTPLYNITLIFQELAIDITDRDPTDHPNGVPYKILAEACTPSINVDDVGSIFEEHRICKNLSVWQHHNQVLSIHINWAYEMKAAIHRNLLSDYLKFFIIWCSYYKWGNFLCRGNFCVFRYTTFFAKISPAQK